ncbi:M16 family metallopeptidase [Sodalinema gerasimenkoae]|uniref:M16 family metallopeptidase n=1 Tax=Sodalinema gerasimenkoae TaxID=2862348 RepID=UPI00135A0A75|nr:pitrilysin family protein [Sodalinema gerasimenkoae]
MPQTSTSSISRVVSDSHCPARTFERPDGLTVVHQYVPHSPVVVTDVWVNAGASVEPDDWSGMAHFLEHAIFKGTDRLGPGYFDAAIEGCGGLTNAATSYDYAHFFITTASPYFSETLPLLSELLLHAAIPEDEFFREREVVFEEIRQSQDSPDDLLFEATLETVYQNHPYRRPVLGTQQSLLGRSPADLRQFHRSHYQPQNLTIAVVGGISELEALDRIDDCFQNFFPNPGCPQAIITPEPPIRGVRRRELAFPRLELARLNLTWTGPGIDHLDDAYGLDLLSMILASGRSSRLVRELREQRQWVQGITSYFSLQRDSSLFTISAWLEPRFLDAVEQASLHQIHRLRETPVDPLELARAQRQLCNDYAFSTETPAQLAGLYGYYQILSRADIATRYPQRIQDFQPDNLRQIARQYLSLQNYVVTIGVNEQ